MLLMLFIQVGQDTLQESGQLKLLLAERCARYVRGDADDPDTGPR
jgi:hypothetical protein